MDVMSHHWLAVSESNLFISFNNICIALYVICLSGLFNKFIYLFTEAVMNLTYASSADFILEV